jgi:hypothetical protein
MYVCTSVCVYFVENCFEKTTIFAYMTTFFVFFYIFTYDYNCRIYASENIKNIETHTPLEQIVNV